MPDNPYMRLPRYVPILGIVCFLLIAFALVHAGSAYDFGNALSAELKSEFWVFGLIPALLCIWIARNAEALPFAILTESVLIGVWAGETIANLEQDLQGATYVTAVIGMLIGFSVTERVTNWLKSDTATAPSSPSESSRQS